MFSANILYQPTLWHRLCGLHVHIFPLSKQQLSFVSTNFSFARTCLLKHYTTKKHENTIEKQHLIIPARNCTIFRYKMLVFLYVFFFGCFSKEAKLAIVVYIWWTLCEYMKMFYFIHEIAILLSFE